MSETGKKVFDQEISSEELKKVAGGDKDEDEYNCVRSHKRDIEEGGFPNCAATVEDWSWCDTNDACETWAVDYYGMRRCHRAYR